jgi:hypothetical protein
VRWGCAQTLKGRSPIAHGDLLYDKRGLPL